jgi:hypothetical protein
VLDEEIEAITELLGFDSVADVLVVGFGGRSECLDIAEPIHNPEL